MNISVGDRFYIVSDRRFQKPYWVTVKSVGRVYAKCHTDEGREDVWLKEGVRGVYIHSPSGITPDKVAFRSDTEYRTALTKRIMWDRLRDLFYSDLRDLNISTSSLESALVLLGIAIPTDEEIENYKTDIRYL